LADHQNFLTLIEPKITAWTPKSTIGKEFFLHTDFIQNYRPYLLNFNTANLSLEILINKYQPLSLLLLGFEMAMTNLSGYRVADILIMPVQRIPRYIMLLNQLQKYTLPTTADYRFLEAAGKKIISTLENINSEIPLDQLSKMEEVVCIRNAIIDCTEEIIPTNLKREFIREGPLTITKISNPDKKKLTNKKIHTILFNDYILFCTVGKERKERKKIKISLLPRDVDYEYVEGGSKTVIEEVYVVKKKEFCIKWKKEEWTFETKSEDDTKAWVSALGK